MALQGQGGGLKAVGRLLLMGPLMSSRHRLPPCDSRTGEIVMPCRIGACTHFGAHHSPSERESHRGEGQAD